MTPFCYINRCGHRHYFKKVMTAKGGFRYYISKKPDDLDLIEAVPEGFEVVELPYDGRVVIRKIVPVLVTAEEIEIVRQAIEQYSPVKDFLVTAEKEAIAIHISQFSHYHGELYPTAEEARELWDIDVDEWKKYDWILSFELTGPKRRSFRVVRKASFQYDRVEIDRGYNLADLAKKYCYHVGRESLLEFWIPGKDW